jgi:hypothetical protein
MKSTERLNGTTAQNTARHEMWSVRKPAMNGPTIEGSTHAADRSVNARGRMSSGKARPRTT